MSKAAMETCRVAQSISVLDINVVLMLILLYCVCSSPLAGEDSPASHHHTTTAHDFYHTASGGREQGTDGGDESCKETTTATFLFVPLLSLATALLAGVTWWQFSCEEVIDKTLRCHCLLVLAATL